MPSSTQFTVDDALELATYGTPSWNEDGTYVGYQCFADGETVYYPEEDRVFRRSETWRDALNRVVPFLDDHLRL